MGVTKGAQRPGALLLAVWKCKETVMRELNKQELSSVGGGEAGVPHDNYYYGPYWYTDWLSNLVDGILDWIEYSH